jgi:hypothetical protein
MMSPRIDLYENQSQDAYQGDLFHVLTLKVLDLGFGSQGKSEQMMRPPSDSSELLWIIRLIISLPGIPAFVIKLLRTKQSPHW